LPLTIMLHFKSLIINSVTVDWRHVTLDVAL
jgi:hypothetical protein